MTSEIVYRGELRTEAMHTASGETIITDAPTDNMGKGEAFSPTDLVATALGACMMTIMGIVAQRHDIDLRGARIAVTKQMQQQPRKIAAVELVFSLPAHIDPRHRQLLENAARTCPVAISLDPSILQLISFNYA